MIFLHVPRTAGSTLHSIIGRQYPPETFITRDLLSDAELQQFKHLPVHEKSNIRFLKAHVSFGVHELLPRPSTYITLFRDPVERVVSFYHYILRRGEDKLFETIAREQMSLETFVRSGIAVDHTDNGFTRLWSGDPFVEHGGCSEDMLMRACDNLKRHCSVVGLTERFDETLVLLKERLRWDSGISYRRENVTRKRPSIDTLPRSTLMALRANNELDQDLYRFAAAMFEEQIAQEGAHLVWRARWFKVCNPISGRTGPVTDRIVRKARSFSSLSP